MTSIQSYFTLSDAFGWHIENKPQKYALFSDSKEEKGLLTELNSFREENRASFIPIFGTAIGLNRVNANWKCLKKKEITKMPPLGTIPSYNKKKAEKTSRPLTKGEKWYFRTQIIRGIVEMIFLGFLFIPVDLFFTATHYFANRKVKQLKESPDTL